MSITIQAGYRRQAHTIEVIAGPPEFGEHVSAEDGRVLADFAYTTLPEVTVRGFIARFVELDPDLVERAVRQGRAQLAAAERAGDQS